ncbi:hypothetical protein AB0M22_43220 [Nocardia sp. NPDC051756]|uniref:hypothetical protein n=1 Tax=Nocardia sp. NPDC051756 TaxID=3154751 RepID=UPI00341A9EA3
MSDQARGERPGPPVGDLAHFATLATNGLDEPFGAADKRADDGGKAGFGIEQWIKNPTSHADDPNGFTGNRYQTISTSTDTILMGLIGENLEYQPAMMIVHKELLRS